MRQSNKNNNRVALVHDFLVELGGAELVLEQFGSIYKSAPLYTLLFDKKILRSEEMRWLQKRKVEESFLKKFPSFLQKRKSWLLPFMPSAPEVFDLRDYDLVISSSGAFSKGVVVKSKTTHICYMHSPMRYVWDWNHEYLEETKLKNKAKFFTRLFLNYLRMWDRASAQRPDYIIANSNYTAERIKKYYQRESKVIYPPIRTDDFSLSGFSQNYFLTVSRLSSYKRVNVLIDAFDKLNLPLVIVGEGKQKRELEEKIKKCKNKSKINIIGAVDRAKLIKIYQSCKAFVFAAEEDFGIAPVEAMAAGKPVIAFRRGGVCETVIEGTTGEFFDDCNVEMIADAVRRFLEKEGTFDARKIRNHAKKFDEKIFVKKFKEFVDNKLGE